MKFVKRASIMSVILGSISLMNCSGYLVATGPPFPPNEVIIQAPSTLHVWVPGYYAYQGGAYVWISGHYTIPPKGKTYVPGQWNKTPKGYKHSKGHWKHN